jgi:hypothetical protein
MKQVEKITRILLIIMMAFLPMLLKAQATFDDDVLDNEVPFDEGAGYLVAAAVIYGLKKATNNKNTDFGSVIQPTFLK